MANEISLGDLLENGYAEAPQEPFQRIVDEEKRKFSELKNHKIKAYVFMGQKKDSSLDLLAAPIIVEDETYGNDFYILIHLPFFEILYNNNEETLREDVKQSLLELYHRIDYKNLPCDRLYPEASQRIV